MTTKRLLPGPRSPARWVEILITLLGLAGIILTALFYEQAFPTAALDLKLSRDEITQLARAYMQEQGYDLQEYNFVLTFGGDGGASTYLQNTVGIPETNRLIQEEDLPIWWWRARWFRPLQEEELSAYLAPDGDLLAFFHTIPEDTPGENLSKEQALALAESYLGQDRGWPLEGWELVSDSSEERPGGRTDHDFEWKHLGFSVGEGELRLHVTVQGDRVDQYDYWLETPESFWRHFREQQERAWFFNNLSYNVGFIGLGLAVLVAALVAVWRGILPWHAGRWAALVVGVVSLLAGLNYLPLYKAWYWTTQDYSMFWIERVFYLLTGAGYTAASMLILWPGAQRLGKLAWPRRDKILPRGEDRWETLARSSWRGLMLAGISAGYTVLFYLVATRVWGGWTPMSSAYTSLYATPLPFLGPLAAGLIPATTEELIFRMAGMALILWWTGRHTQWPKAVRWGLALLIPGVLWAFAHLGYVRDPFYLRGIELLIAAVFLEGLFFLCFDLTTVIVAHFAFNAVGTAWPLLRSGEPYFVFSGLVIFAFLLAPAVPGLVRAIRRRQRGDKLGMRQAWIAEAAEGDLAGLTALPLEGMDWAGLLADPAVVLLRLRTGQEVVGAAVGELTGNGGATVRTVYVSPRWRRRYWGSALADALYTSLQERGATDIQVSIRTSNRAATAFWASLDWRPTVQLFSRSTVAAGRSWRERLGRLGAAFKRSGGAQHLYGSRKEPLK